VQMTPRSSWQRWLRILSWLIGPDAVDSFSAEGDFHRLRAYRGAGYLPAMRPDGAMLGRPSASQRM